MYRLVVFLPDLLDVIPGFGSLYYSQALDQAKGLLRREPEIGIILIVKNWEPISGLTVNRNGELITIPKSLVGSIIGKGESEEESLLESLIRNDLEGFADMVEELKSEKG